MIAWLRVSPMPASGPMRPVLTAVIASPETLPSLARCSSIATLMPMMTMPM